MTGETDLLHAEISGLREQVRTLEADNAAVVRVCTDPALHPSHPPAQGTTCPTCKVLFSDHPGAALLAEMEGLRKELEQYMLNANTSGVKEHRLEHEVTALRSEVKRLTEERDEALGAVEHTRAVRMAFDEAHMLLDRAGYSLVCPHLPSRVRALLATCEDGWAKAKVVYSLRTRVAELEAKSAIWERAASLAGEAALEEAANELRDISESIRKEALDTADDVLRSKRLLLADDRMGMAAVVRALKSQPGLTLGVVNATPVRVIGAPPRAPRPEPMLMLSCPGLAVGISYTYVNHLARCGGWSDRDSPYQEQDEQMRNVIDEAVRLLGGLGEKP